jgi:hypothetical protein
MAAFMLSLVAILDITEAARNYPLQIYDASLDLKSTEVGIKTDAALSMTRLDSPRASKWETDKCFELFIWSPYKDWRSYKPFQGGAGIEPECYTHTSLGGKKDDGTEQMKVNCKVKKDDFWILQFYFTDIPAGMESRQVVNMMFTNFHTPWSGQNLKTIEIRYYDDKECVQN